MEDKTPPQSTIIGTFLMLIGVAPPVLWIGHVTGLLPLTTDMPWWILFGWPVIFIGVGGMLIRGEGRTLGEVAQWWVKERFGGGE